MRRLALIALLLTMAPSAPRSAPAPQVPARDVKGWRTTSWGMTVDQVRAAMKDEDIVAEEENPGWYQIRSYRIGDDQLLARMEFASSRFGISGLSKVILAYNSLVESAYVFPRLEASLIKKYGAESSKDQDVTSMHWEERRIWSFPSTTIELSWTRFYARPSEVLSSMVFIEYAPVGTGEADKL